jgi:hypothetical protein
VPYNLPVSRRRRQLRRQAARYAALALVGVLGLVGFGLLVWRVPPLWYADVPDLSQRAADEASTRTGFIAGLVGLAALGNLAMVSRTYRLTQQGQITDRYTKAVEQLGGDKLDVCLGGIYALERIAVDSKRDHPTIVEVLSTFVRERTNLPWAENRTTSQGKPAADVQAAVTVLGRLPHRKGVSRGDLQGALLMGAQLLRANLSGVLFFNADLSGAALLHADLSGAAFMDTNLSDALLSKADLSNTHLFDTDLSRANLRDADLSAAWFHDTDLFGAELQGANLSRAKGLTQEQLNMAKGDKMTKLPKGLQRPTAWLAARDPL